MALPGNAFHSGGGEGEHLVGLWHLWKWSRHWGWEIDMIMSSFAFPFAPFTALLSGCLAKSFWQNLTQSLKSGGFCFSVKVIPRHITIHHFGHICPWREIKRRWGAHSEKWTLGETLILKNGKTSLIQTNEAWRSVWMKAHFSREVVLLKKNLRSLLEQNGI